MHNESNKMSCIFIGNEVATTFPFNFKHNVPNRLIKNGCSQFYICQPILALGLTTMIRVFDKLMSFINVSNNNDNDF